MIWANKAKKYLNAEFSADTNQISELIADEIVFNDVPFLKDEFINLPRTEPIGSSIKFIDCCYRDKYICCEYEIFTESTNDTSKFVMIIKFNHFGKISYVHEYHSIDTGF